MKHLFKTVALLLLTSLNVCGQIQWSNFRWGHDSINVNGQKAFVPRSAIFLPVYFNGDPRRYYMQLDLSSDKPMILYGTPSIIDNKYVTPVQASNGNPNRYYSVNRELKGKLGEIDFTLDSTQYLLMKKKDDTSKDFHRPSTASAIIGTIGLPYFKKKILVLDFSHEQFLQYDDTLKIPERFSKAKFYVPSHISNSRLIVPVEYMDTTFNDFFYETGSSIFDLVTSKKIWCKLTGKTGDEKDNFTVTVDMWGDKLVFRGARPKMPIRVNNTYLTTAMVFYLPSDEDFKDTYGCNGMIGNTPFFSKVIVLDFIRNKFGMFNAL